MHAVILAAGFGTRLSPLTNELAKPAIPLFDVPLIVHAIRSVWHAGVTNIAVNVHHLSDTVVAAVEGACLHRDLNVVFSQENKLLGTAGGVRRAWQLMPKGDDALVFNSDIQLLNTDDLHMLIRRHKEFRRNHPKHRATLLVTEKHGGPVGMLDKSAPQITRLRNTGKSDTDFDLCGAYVLSAEAISELAEEGDIVSENFVNWFDGSIRGVLGGPFADVGTLCAYLDAHLQALSKRNRSRVGQGVRSERSSLTRCWVGDGATIVNAILSECVVWPGAYVSGVYERAIITSTQVVPVPG